MVLAGMDKAVRQLEQRERVKRINLKDGTIGRQARKSSLKCSDHLARKLFGEEIFSWIVFPLRADGLCGIKYNASFKVMESLLIPLLISRCALFLSRVPN